MCNSFLRVPERRVRVHHPDRLVEPLRQTPQVGVEELGSPRGQIPAGEGHFQVALLEVGNPDQGLHHEAQAGDCIPRAAEEEGKEEQEEQGVVVGGKPGHVPGWKKNKFPALHCDRSMDRGC